mgnify:CR=1 FL=1
MKQLHHDQVVLFSIIYIRFNNSNEIKSGREDLKFTQLLVKNFIVL